MNKSIQLSRKVFFALSVVIVICSIWSQSLVQSSKVYTQRTHIAEYNVTLTDSNLVIVQIDTQLIGIQYTDNR